jgi:FkbM family methyltransferase
MTSVALRAARSAVSYLPDPSLLFLRSLSGRLRPGTPHEADFSFFARFANQSPTIIDVGANRGQSIRSFHIVFDRPVIHAVEPNPLLADYVARHMDLGGGSVSNVALSAAPGTLELFIPRYGNTWYDTRASASVELASSFLEHGSFLFFDAKRAGVERIEVEMRTMDSMGLAPEIIKIDVEGAELGVLEGGADTIRSNEPLLLIEEPGAPAIELLHSWGYEPFELRAGELRPFTGSALNTFFLGAAHRSGPEALIN